MREIKFRAWYKGVMYYQVGVTPLFIEIYDWAKVTPGFIEGTDPMLYEQKSISPPRRMSVGRGLAIKLTQYTGLKDKNGVEIYEGDVVQSVTHEGGILISDIEWSEGTAAFVQRGDWACALFATREVIGNIYENPELLDGNS